MDPLEKRYHDQVEAQERSHADGGDLGGIATPDHQPWHETGLASDLERDLHKVQQQEAWLLSQQQGNLLDPAPRPTNSPAVSTEGIAGADHNPQRWLLVVDTARPDWQQRIDQLGGGADLLLLEPGEQGLARIQEAIQNRPYRSITLLPGSDGNGRQHLGRDVITAAWQQLLPPGSNVDVIRSEPNPEQENTPLDKNGQETIEQRQGNGIAKPVGEGGESRAFQGVGLERQLPAGRQMAIATQVLDLANELIDVARSSLETAQADGSLHLAISEAFTRSNRTAIEELAKTFIEGKEEPVIRWAKFQQEGIRGAYLGDSDTILINETLLNDKKGELKAVLLEEIGHWLEEASQINASDSQGDEGERFASRLLNLTEAGHNSSLDDSATLWIDGSERSVELSEVQVQDPGASLPGRTNKEVRNKGAFAAILNNGSVVTWGNAAMGGDSSSVTDLLNSDVVEVFSTGSAFAALKRNGSVVTWGSQTAGGSPTVYDNTTGYGSVASNLQSGVVTIASTEWAFAALKSDGSVVTWGQAFRGADSGGTTANKISSDVVALYSTNEAFAALKRNGEVVTWPPQGGGGQLSYTTTNGSTTKYVSSKVSSGVVSLASNSSAFAALKNDGSVVTWGAYSFGNNSNGADSEAVSSLLASGVIEIVGNNLGFAARKANGQIITWGNYQQLGYSGTVIGSGATKIFTTNAAFAALTSNGSVVTWGMGGVGGNSTAVAQRLSSDVIHITRTENAFAALKNDGSVVTWGVSTNGGDSTAVSSALTSGVVKVVGNGGAFAAIKNTGEVITWGSSSHGGNGRNQNQGLASGVVEVVSGEMAFVAMKADGTIIAWGDPLNGGSLTTQKQSSLATGVVSISDIYKKFNSPPTVSVVDVTGSIGELAWNEQAAGLTGTLHSESGSFSISDADLSDVQSIAVTPPTGARGNLAASIDNNTTGDGQGTVAWTYTISEAALNSLAAGEMIEEIFTVTVSDGQGESVNQQITITLMGSNDAPSVNIDQGAIQEDAILTRTAVSGILSNDIDADAADQLQVIGVKQTLDSTEITAVSFGSPGVISNSHGTLTVNADGSYSFAANGPDSQALRTGTIATTSFTVEISDGITSRSSVLSFAITGVNDAPVVSGLVDLGSMLEDGTFTITRQQLLANASDVDAGDTLSVVELKVSQGQGTLTANANGSWTFAPAPDWNGAVQFSYRISDGTSTVGAAPRNDLIIRDNHLYVVVDGPTWAEAQANAEALGGYLTSVDNQAENEFLINRFSSNAVLTTEKYYGINWLNTYVAWIGLSYNQQTRTWENSQGQDQTYFNWVTGTRDGVRPYNNYQPNDTVGASIFLASADSDYTGGMWEDNPTALADFKRSGIAEIPFVRWGDSAYVVVEGPSWEEAEANAVKIGGHLVTINNPTENEWIAGSFGLGNTQDWKFWIGLTNNGQETEWQSQDWFWTSGDTSSYRQWHEDQPWIDDNSKYAFINLPSQQVNTLQNEGVWVPYGNYFAYDWEDGVYGVREPKGIAEIKLTLTANLGVASVNDPPRLQPDQAAAIEDQPLYRAANQGLLSNDLDAEGSTLRITSITDSSNGQSVLPGPSGSLLITNSYGSLSVQANGAYTFLANGPDSQKLAQGATATLNFTYSVSDGELSATSPFTITVTGANDAPAAQADQTSIIEDAVLVRTAANGLLSNDSDVDAGTSLRITSIRNGTSGTPQSVPSNGSTSLSNAYGTLTVGSDGSYSFNANGPDAQALGVGASAQTSFTYSVSDGISSQTSTLTLTIQGQNDSPRVVPPLAPLPPGVEGTDYFLRLSDLLAGIQDPDLGDQLSVGSISQGGEDATPLGNGTWLLRTASNNQVDLGSGAEDSPITLSLNQLLGGSLTSRTLTINYTVADGKGGVLLVSRQLELERPVNLTGASVVSLTVLDNQGSAIRQSDGSWLVTPNLNVNGLLNLTYTVQAGGAQINYTGTLSINPLNDPPTRLSGAIQPLVIAEDSTATSLGLTTFSYGPGGGSDEANQPLSYRLVGLPPSALGAVLLADGSGVTSGQSLSLEAIRGLQFRPNANAHGSAAVQLEISDNTGGTATESIDITVTPANDAAVFTVPGSLQLQEDQNTQVVDGTTLLRNSGQFTVSDVDAPSEAAFQTTVLGINNPLGQLNLSSSGAFTYSVNNSLEAVQALRLGEQRVDTFEIRSVDGTSRQVSFTIQGSADLTSARLIDGYIESAKVYVDLNNDGQLNWSDANNNNLWDPGEGEAWVSTDAQGALNFDFGSPSGRLRSVGGTDTSTGLAFTGSLSAPAGSAVITPLTSLVLATADRLSGGTPQARLAAAENTVRQALGIQPSQALNQFDPIATLANPNLSPAARQQALEVQQRAAQIANLISIAEATGQGGGTVVNALVASVQTSGNAPLNLADPTTLSNLLNTGASTPVNPAIVANVASANGLINQSTSLQGVVNSQQMAQGDLATSITQTRGGAGGWLGVRRAVVAENASPGTVVAQLSFDTGITQVPAASGYRLTSSDPTLNPLPFSIGVDGTVRVANQVNPALLNFEQRSQPFALVVEALDGNNGVVNSTTLTIRLQDINEAPLTAPDQLAMDLRLSLMASRNASQGLLANDSDLDAGDTLRVDMSSGATLVNTYGTLSIAVDGSFSFNADGAASRALAAGQIASTTFTYTTVDALGLSSTNTLTITVTGRNDAPEINGPVPSLTPGQEGAAYTVTRAMLLQSITDPDSGDQLQIANLRIRGGTVVDNGNGTWTITGPSSNSVNLGYLPEDTERTFGVLELLGGSLSAQQISLSYDVVDQSGASVSQRRDLELLRQSVLQSAAISGVQVSQGQASVVANGNGTWTLIPAANATGSVQLSYQVSTGGANSRTVSADLELVGLNDAPQLQVPSTAQLLNEDGSLLFSTANGNRLVLRDVDANQLELRLHVNHGTLTLAALTGINLLEGVSGSSNLLRIQGSAAAINAALEGLLYSPDPEFNGVDELTLTANDRGQTGLGAEEEEEAFARVGLTVAAVADQPVISGDNTAQVTDGSTPLHDEGTLTFVDADRLPENQVSTSYLGATGPTVSDALQQALTTALVTRSIGNSNGTVAWSFDLAPELLKGLQAGATITARYEVSVGDGTTTNSNTQLITVTLLGSNDGPAISINPASGNTPAGSFAATLSETNAGLTTSGSLSIADPDLNTASLTPNILSVTPSGTTNGLVPTNAQLLSMLRLTPGALTNGQGALSWSFDSGAEVFNYLAAGESLTLTYSFTVSDTSGAASSPQSITITVYGSNDGPQLTGPQAVLPNTPEDASISLTSAQLLSGFSDPDASDSLRVTNLAATNGTLLQQPDGSWSYKPDPDVNGPVNLSYTVTDTRGAFISATNTFSITPLNDPPRRLDTNGPRSLFLIEDAPATTLGLANLAWATGAQRNLNTDQLQQITGDEALQTLSFSITALPDSAIGSLLLADNTPVTQGQTLSLAQLQSLRFSPTPNAYGNTAFSYTVTDSAGASTSESFSISVLPVNDLPVQLSDVLNPRVITRDRLKLEGGQYQLISLELAQLDISAGEATGQTVQYQIAALPDSTLGVVLRADGTTPVLLGDSLSTAEMRGLLFRPDRDVEKLPSANRLGQLQLTVVDDGSAEQGGAQSLRFSLPILVDVDKASGRMGRRITGITTDEQAIRAAMSLDPTNPSPGLAPSRDAQGNAVQTRGMSATLYSQLERDNPLYLAEIGGAGIIDGLPMNYVPAAVPFLFDLPVISNTPGEQITHTLTYKSTLTGQFRSNDSGANRYQAIGNVAGFELSAAGSWTFDPLNDAYQGINLGDSQLLTIPYRDRDGGPERILTLELSCIAQAPDGSRTIMATPSGAGANATTFSRGEWIQSSPQGREMDRYFKFISEATLISYGAIDSGTRNADGERVFTWLATAATADGKPLTLLDGTIITSPGYYDFTRRNGNGDGVEFIYQTVREKGRDVDYIVGMNFFLTNNMYGDNDPAANNIRDPGAPISVMPELGEIVYSSAFASYENISNDSLFAKNLPRIRFGNAAAGGPGTFDGGSGPLLNASDPGQGISAMTMSSSSPALPGANGAALSTGQAAINLQGGGDGDNTNNDSGDLASQGNAERAEAAAEGDGGSAKLAKSGQDKGQRGLKLDPIQQLGSAATAEPDTLLEQLSETNILGTNLLDALALGAGVLYLLYGPKARETGKGGLGTWLAGFGRRSGGSAAASGERAVLALFLTRVEGGKQQLVAARIGMGSLRLLAQRELGRDADADQLGDALQALLEQLPGQEAELLLLDPRLNGAATAAELNRLAQHQQPLASDLLAAPLAACSDSELAQLRAWLNKPSATSIEGLAIAELLRQRQQSYQSNLPAEQAGVASMVELSLALAWSQRQR